MTITRAELRQQVASLTETLSGLGVGIGDRVVGYLPNIAEAIVAFLATASLGAIWSSVGQDYAVPSVVERFSQLEPTVLVAADRYRFGGRDHERSEAVAALRDALPTVQATVVVPRLHDEVTLSGAISWDEATSGAANDNPPLVLFSSGTTGLQKGIVHGHGGVLVEQLKSLGLHWELQPENRLFGFTSPSWVMWNLLLSGRATGSTVVTYDGSPTYPDTSALWRVVADVGVTVSARGTCRPAATWASGRRPTTTSARSARWVRRALPYPRTPTVGRSRRWVGFPCSRSAAVPTSWLPSAVVRRP